VLREILIGAPRIGERSFDWFEQDVVDAAQESRPAKEGGKAVHRAKQTRRSDITSGR